MLGSLRSRLAAYEDTGDPSGILSDAATEEAALLVDAVREHTASGADGAWDDDALATAGRLHWKRHLTTPPSDTVHHGAAILLFARPYRARRSLVPEVLWSQLAEHPDDTPALDLVSTPAEEIAELAEALLADDPTSAEALIPYLRVAAGMLPARHPGRPPLLSALGLAGSLLARSVPSRGDALDVAVEAAREAAATMADTWPGRAVLLSRLGLFLWERHQRDGREEDLTDSERHNRAAVLACGDDDPARPGCLHNLVLALISRYQLTGDPAVLDEAVENGREAVRSSRPGLPAAPLHATSLAAALRLRFERTGGAEDLAEAEKVLTAALDLAGEDGPYRSLVLTRLGEPAEVDAAPPAPDEPPPDEPPAVESPAVESAPVESPPGRSRVPPRRRWRWWRGR
ncbi:hypothetical protein HTZ77_10150 [Nonomuraea sp. SMC257]|uniref:Tetratricopeptide repeat protein n=1 Tax=Nonomuraea montanisoli TaxID=2741721 RepID=A0A7Y6M243_9ACTN|nr:hypothetical protein [Nonomuraea montanisoli]